MWRAMRVVGAPACEGVQVVVQLSHPGQLPANSASIAARVTLTHSLCLRDGLEARLIFPRFPTEFVYLTMDVADSDVSRLRLEGGGRREEVADGRDRTLSRSSRVVGNSLMRRCHVAERCLCTVTVSARLGTLNRTEASTQLERFGDQLTPGGIATAPAIVMGYLMYKFGWEYTTALAYVQSKRYCVSPASVSVVSATAPLSLSVDFVLLADQTRSDEQLFTDRHGICIVPATTLISVVTRQPPLLPPHSPSSPLQPANTSLRFSCASTRPLHRRTRRCPQPCVSETETTSAHGRTTARRTCSCSSTETNTELTIQRYATGDEQATAFRRRRR